MENLLNSDPKDILVQYGPTKLLVDRYHWHSPKTGIVTSYTPNEYDVNDHFGIFRGVDQIESFAQATIASCCVFLECLKQNLTPAGLLKVFNAIFISLGNVSFHSYLKQGDTYVCIGQIKFYKFRQMVCDGRIYKVPQGLDLDEYFRNYTDEKLLSYDLSSDFTLIAELKDVTGRAVKKELLNLI